MFSCERLTRASPHSHTLADRSDSDDFVCQIRRTEQTGRRVQADVLERISMPRGADMSQRGKDDIDAMNVCG